MQGVFLNPNNIGTKALRYWSHEEENLPFFLGEANTDFLKNVIIKDFLEMSKQIVTNSEANREKDDSRFNIQPFIIRMVEVLDFFERVLEGVKNEAPGSSVILEFERIYAFLKKELADSKVVKFETHIGDFPKPESHKVISRESISDMPPGAICKIVKEGYLWEKKLLRKANVITAK